MTKKNKKLPIFNKHHQYLQQIPKIPQKSENIKILSSAKEFHYELLLNIINANNRICLVALYLEQDESGIKILNTLFKIKKEKPNICITILVDWHRAQRNRIGITNKTPITNTQWYYTTAQKNPYIDVPIYGVPINTQEALGVFHLKGFIIDNTVIYSGANLNDVYLHQKKTYRYDRYHIIKNPKLADTMYNYIHQQIIINPAVNRLDKQIIEKKKRIKNYTKILRKNLKKSYYNYTGLTDSKKLTITPIVGLGKKNNLNTTIYHLIYETKNKITLSTPYFNLPKIIFNNLVKILHQGKLVEIIVGDKTANDFYIPNNKPFKLIGILPYLYEINLRFFLKKLQKYLDKNQLIVKIWKHENNGYHIKGIWIDNEWQLITGNNLNPRGWKLDLENALLIHDPEKILINQWKYELKNINIHTKYIKKYTHLESISEYPIKIKKLINNIRRIHVDKIIKKIS